MGRGSLGRVLLLQLSSHLVPLLLQKSSHLVPLLLQESSLHFLSFFVKTFLVYFNIYGGTSPYKGHNRIHLHSKNTFHGPKWLFLHTYNTLVTSKKWTTSLKRTKNWFQCVLYLEVPLYRYTDIDWDSSLWSQ